MSRKPVPLADNAAFESAGLCSKCHLMCTKHFKALTSPSGYEHYNAAEYESSAERGCRLCKTVTQTWFDTPRGKTRWYAVSGGKDLGSLPVTETHPLQGRTLDGLRIRDAMENETGTKLCDLLAYSSPGKFDPKYERALHY